MKNKKQAVVYQAFINAGFSIDLAKLLTAQSAFETANFTSKLFKTQNNLNGMKEAKLRDTTDIDEGYILAEAGVQKADSVGYSEYHSINEAALDMRKYWLSFKLPEYFDSVKDFCAALKNKGYFEASLSGYTIGVKYYYSLYYGG